MHLGSEIVYTTPADGNVWKRLLSAINPWFHADHHADHDDNDTELGYGKNTDIYNIGST